MAPCTAGQAARQRAATDLAAPPGYNDGVSIVNAPAREIAAKVVYYGPGLSGKTTSLKQVYAGVRPETRGQLISLSTEGDRTLFFDFLPLKIEQIRGLGAAAPALHRARPGLLRRHPEAGPQRRRRGGLRRRLAARRHRREPRVDVEPARRTWRRWGSTSAPSRWSSSTTSATSPSALPVEQLRRELNRRGAPDFETATGRQRHAGAEGDHRLVMSTCAPASRRLVVMATSKSAAGGRPGRPDHRRGGRDAVQSTAWLRRGRPSRRRDAPTRPPDATPRPRAPRPRPAPRRPRRLLPPRPARPGCRWLRPLTSPGSSREGRARSPRWSSLDPGAGLRAAVRRAAEG